MANEQQKSPWVSDTTDATFDADVVERSRELPVVVDFWAEWCQPCRLLGPILEKVAAEYDGKFLLVKADTDQTPSAATRYGVQGIPAVFGFRDGQLVDFFVGVLPEEQFRAWVTRLLPTPAETAVAAARQLATTDTAAAEAKYRVAIELDANLPQAKIGLAALLLDESRVPECRELIEQLQQRGFLEPDAERIRAQLDLREKGAEVGSVDECRAAVAADPHDYQLQLKLAEALAAAAQYEEALETTLNVIRADRQQFGDAGRQIMVDIFQLLPEDSELTGTYRRQLATALY